MYILIADDEAGVRNSLSLLLKDKHDVVLCEDGESALRNLEKTAVDLVITDHAMPKLTGLELIRKGKEVSPQTAFILMTAFGSVEQAVEAIRLGADDYFMKPFDLSEIELRVRKIEDLRAWGVENALRQQDGKGAARLIGRSRNIQQAREFVESVKSVSSPVLILGPSGAGKEVLAKAIHETSPRSSRPFVAINCASLSEQLMDSELFGHEKGAFTGASASKPGKFELAKGGTLFLDEIGELPGALQAKLLRVLQEKEFFRVGGVRQIKSDARVVAATHRDLKAMVKEGTFREDLFFRLNVLTFELEPIARRPEDLEVLIDFLWGKACSELGKKVRLSEEARGLMLKYSYPGNVRELQNVIERLIVLGSQTGQAAGDLLPKEFQTRDAGSSGPVRRASTSPIRGLADQLDELEASLLQEAMRQTGQNQVKAAALLKITRSTFQYKWNKHFGGRSDADDNAA